MLERCYYKKRDSYRWYGGNGVKVCDEWRGKDGFIHFLADMGEKPAGTSIDRIDNDGDYKPSNCRWATQREQQNNRSSNRHIRYKGARLTLAEAARVAGIAQDTFSYRLCAGWPVEKAITTPLRGQRNNRSLAELDEAERKQTEPA